VHVLVRGAGASAPVAGARISAGARSAATDDSGRATLALGAGPVRLVAARLGFAPDTVAFTLAAGADTSIAIALQPAPAVEPAVIVSSTREARRLQDEPMRVEVLGGDDVSEKNEMRPGDLSTLLSELSGVHMQSTSPSLGATNVRLEGLPGRYTLVLQDGLPLYGAQASGFSLVEQPPLDLKQAEVIKGAASSLYGPSALGGVVDLISRQPPDTSQLLANGTSQGGADLEGFDARQLNDRFGLTTLVGVHRQLTADPDRDGFSDLPGVRRVEVRPRLFYNDGAGRSFMLTAGAMTERRSGGALPGRSPLPGPAGLDSLSTNHLDAGAIGSDRVNDALTVAFRASANTQSRDRVTSGSVEHERQSTVYGELSATVSRGRQVLIAGAAWEGDRYINRQASWANETWNTPSVFVQHSYEPVSWLSSTLDGRCDASSAYGTICTPRASLLFKPSRTLSVRASLGAGWSAPSALNDQTEATGLAYVRPGPALHAERAQSASLDVTASRGPFQVNATLFSDVVRDPVGLLPLLVPGPLPAPYAVLANAPGDLRTHGGELFAVYDQEPWVVTAYYSATRSREISLVTGLPREAPFVPREQAGVDWALEDDDSGTYLAAEIFYTGRQALQDDPYRSVSAPYTTIGILAAKRVGRVTLFANADDLSGVRQSAYEPLVRPSPGQGGTWMVDAWGPLDGRRFNAGVRVHY
ncbi:MAG: TonB-dependent receptor, partial [Gemmatimonadota bacterium]|nr:TonB-dependent receptor [Gemmatimonadota bacterium]